jgi:hypothetical protein
MSRNIVVLEVAECWSLTPTNLKAESYAEFSNEPEARIQFSANDILSHRTIPKRAVQPKSP